MSEHMLLALTAVIALGVSAQWIAWRFGLPSILLLLLFGFGAGLAANTYARELAPDSLFGHLLLPIVSLSVGLILYEGGLSLDLREIKDVRSVVLRLVTVGILVTWALAAVAAHYLIGLQWSAALLIGAVLVVSGPTVIMPMLRFLRPTAQLGSIIKWEGIVNDPIGALLAVLVFESLLAGGYQEVTSIAIVGMLKTVVLGGALGFVGALALALLIRRHWIPDFLHNAISLMFVTVAYTAADLVQEESGLFAVTVMGVVLANQRLANVSHIIEFKEHLRVMLISTLFILLSARLTIDDLAQLGWGSLLFVAVLIVIIRPLAVLSSTIGTGLAWRERVLLSWLAPRGIVAAAIASVFALRLEEHDPRAALLGPLAFLVIVATVAVYGLTAPLLARRLGVADPNPQGFLIVGAHRWARSLAEVLQREGLRVLLIDTNRAHTSAARMAGLPAFEGNVLVDFLEQQLDFQGLGRALAVTPNDEVNALAVRRFERTFGRKEVYQVAPAKGRGGKPMLAHELHGRILFGSEQTFGVLNQRVAAGAVIRATPLTESFNFDAFRERYGADVLPLVVIRGGSAKPLTAQTDQTPKPGDTLVSLGPPDKPENTNP